MKFRFAVTNTGNVPLSNVTLTDKLQGETTAQTVPGPLTDLLPGASRTYEIGPFAAAAGLNTDTATATATYTYPNSTQTVPVPEASDTASYFGASPSITVTKTVSVDGGTSYEDANDAPFPMAVVGANVIFKFQIHNSGNVDLTNVTLTDDTYVPIMTLGGLAAKAWSDEYVVTAVAQLGSQTDTATAMGYWNDAPPCKATDSATYVGTKPGGIAIVKWVKVDGGDWASDAPWPQTALDVSVQYKLQVTNTGGVTLSEITLQDQLGGDSPFMVSSPEIPESLAPGDSFTVEFTDPNHLTTLASNNAEDLSNTTDTATVRAVWTDSGQVHPVNASASAAYFGVNPVIALKKYVLTSPDGVNYTTAWDADAITDAPKLLVGTSVKYRFVLTNPGNVDFTNIVLHDSVPAHDADLQVQLATAPKPVPGGSPSTADPVDLEIGPYEVVQGLQTDVANATGYFYDLPSNTSQDKANYSGVAPELTIEKQVSADGVSWHSSASVLQGSKVYFQFVVTNSSTDYDLENVLVTDLTLGFSYTIDALSKGTSVTLSAPVPKDTSNDPTNTTISNTATASAACKDDAGAQTTLSPSSTASYTVTPVQVSLTVKKQVLVNNCGTPEIYDGDAATSSVPYALVGHEVKFRFTITNPVTSTVPVTVTSLTDVPDLGSINISLPQILAPGTSVTGDSTPITVTDASLNIQSDTVTANAYWTDSSSVQHLLDASDTAAYLPAKPKIQVTKQVSVDGGKTWKDAVDVTVGNSVLFRFIVTNVGNVTLSNIGLTDSPLDITTYTGAGSIPGQLAPGASFSCTAGPFTAAYGFHEDTATASGSFLGVTCCVKATATATASYTGVLAMCTYTKGGYANNGAPGKLLNKYFSTAFPKGLMVGNYNVTGKHGLLWQGNTTGLTNLKSFLLGGGPSGSITKDYLNPGGSCTAGGTLAKQVATLTINITLGNVQGTGIPGGLGGLHYCHAGDSLNGKTISEILCIANQALGQNKLPAGYDFGSLNTLVTNINEGFDECGATSWAVSNLKP